MCAHSHVCGHIKLILGIFLDHSLLYILKVSHLNIGLQVELV